MGLNTYNGGFNSTRESFEIEANDQDQCCAYPLYFRLWRGRLGRQENPRRCECRSLVQYCAGIIGHRVGISYPSGIPEFGAGRFNGRITHGSTVGADTHKQLRERNYYRGGL